MLTAQETATCRCDLGDGLVLRWSTAEDTERIAQLVATVFRQRAEDPPNLFMQDQVRRLMRGDHPLMDPGDYALVEDTGRAGSPVVACTCLYRHVWSYEGIHFGVGRPELVATDPGYRQRGLVRALFQLVHARSAEEGHLAQAITGIPYFYRQFGYEYALDLGGKRATYLALIPKAADGVPEPYSLRPATMADVPYIAELYERASAGSPIRTIIPERYWRYQVEASQGPADGEQGPANSGSYISLQMVVDAGGAARGWVITPGRRWGPELQVWALDVGPEVSLQAAMPSLLRALQAYGLQMPLARPEVEPLREIGFHLGRSHPVYDVLGRALAPISEPPQAWYVRVPDLPTFVRHITPVLERRLAASPGAGYSGELKLDLYRSGLRLAFAAGRLTAAEPWSPPSYSRGAGAGCPPLVFLQMLFGYRGLDELRQIYPDVWAYYGEAEVLLKALFPAQVSRVVPG